MGALGGTWKPVRELICSWEPSGTFTSTTDAENINKKLSNTIINVLTSDPNNQPITEQMANFLMPYMDSPTLREVKEGIKEFKKVGVTTLNTPKQQRTSLLY